MPRERRNEEKNEKNGDGGNVYPSTENENCIVERPYERAESPGIISALASVMPAIRRPRSALSLSLSFSIAINARHQ